jgi:hypothetical protein
MSANDAFGQTNFSLEDTSITDKNAATNSVIKSSINYAIGACYQPRKSWKDPTGYLHPQVVAERANQELLELSRNSYNRGGSVRTSAVGHN